MMIVCMLALGLLMAGCSGKGSGGNEATTTSTSTGGSGSGNSTIIKGKVSLSNSVLTKPAAATFANLRFRDPSALGLWSRKATAGQTFKATATNMNSKLNAPFFASAFSAATVDMYDADHPEWLYPVSTTTTDSDGSYTLSTMANAAKNTGATYSDGDSIPVGNYTIVAYTGFGLGEKPTVAVQSIVKNFDGTVPNVDFEILPSDVAPAAIYMFGEKKIVDDAGNDIWGSTTTYIPANSAIQITFSMPMWRDSLSTGITICQSPNTTCSSSAVAGHWSLSADWLTATYYLESGVQMTPDQTYSVTIFGEDQLGHGKVLNVYGNSIKKTAYGTFKASTADTISPTVQWNSPTVIEMGSQVDVTQPFRVESNKMLDVNGITIKGSPSIGVKPGVLFLGKNAANLYVYEFMLGEPLMLDTNYSLTVTNGKDLSGHVMNALTGSIKTKDAAHTSGIDSSASPEIQNMQAQVKSVFGRWVRAMNDRNLGQWQNVMSGEFYLEYDTTRGIDKESDVNRDGRYTIGEFSTMLYTKAFPQWDYCGSTITGEVSPTPGDSINVIPLTMTADFEFKLNAANSITSKQCSETAPKESFYATVKYKNGGWRIVRASQGIDTREKEIVKPKLVDAKLYQQSKQFLFWVNDREIFDGMSFDQKPDDQQVRAKYAWDAVSGVTTYVIVFADERRPDRGMAIAVNSSVTTYVTGSASDPFADLAVTDALDVSSKFGFSTNHTSFNLEDGGRYYWEVLGFGSATSKADPLNPNDPNFLGNKTIDALLKDITATSRTKRFVIPGLYQEMLYQVRAGTSTTSTPVKYNAGMRGYDLGNSYQATITIQSKPTATWGFIVVWGSQLKVYEPLTFTSINGGPATLTQTVTLYNGMNDIYVYDSMDALMAEAMKQLMPKFTILTAGGMPPVINIWEVKDDSGAILAGDKWKYYDAPGASKISVNGAISDMSVRDLKIQVRNEFGPQYNINSFATSTVTGDNLFTTATLTTSPTPPDLDIYKGANYIDFSYYGGSNTQYFASMTVYTDTGSVWVAPIAIAGITAPGATFTKKADYSNSADWEAALAGAPYTATISGKFKNTGTGSYNSWSQDGGGSSWGNLVSDSTGSFSFSVLLYTGWNSVSVYDPGSMNSYYLNINTNQTGKPIIKPTVVSVNGTAYSGSGAITTNQCLATISATSEPGSTSIWWTGNDGATSYSEYQKLQNPSGPPTLFSFVVPLVSTATGATGNSSNVVSIQDSNYRSTGITILTTANCPYSAATTSLVSMSGNVSAPTPAYTPGNSYYNAGSNSTVSFTGTTNRPGATISAQFWVCGEYEYYSTVADASGNWTISNVALYNGGGWVYLSGPGNSWQSIYLPTTSNIIPTTRERITLVTGATATSNSCGISYWNAGASPNISITGTTTGVLNGTGSYTDLLNSYHQFTITNGTFQLNSVPVYKGSNNVLTINIDDPAGQTSHTMNISSTNGNVKPQYVKITSLVSGNTYTGAQTISGSISDANASGFNIANATLTAYVSSQTYSSFSTDSYYQTNYGYLPITYNASTGAFSFTGLFNANWCSYVQINAWDNVSRENHYENMYVNCNYSHTYAKPGAAPVPDPNEALKAEMAAEAMRQFMSEFMEQ